MSETKQEEQKLYLLSGSLPKGRWLVSPLTVLIEHDGSGVVVSEPQFYMHASAPTEVEAIEAFKRTFSGYLDILTAEEETLGAHLHDQLCYLRSYIRSA